MYDPSQLASPAPNPSGDSAGLHPKGVEYEPQILDAHGIKSTKLPQLDLIPKPALVALANRMELGIQRKGVSGVWNPFGVTSKEFTIERLSHVIHHCYDAIAKLKNGDPWSGEEDAGAILFGGTVLAVYKNNLRKDA